MPTPYSAAVIRWCELLARTASTAEETARWRELARRYTSRQEPAQ